jgi:hypothetical protein
MVFFSVGWTPLQALYPSEILSYQNRAKGLSLQGWGASAAGLINTFGLPPALGAIDYIGQSLVKSNHRWSKLIEQFT